MSLHSLLHRNAFLGEQVKGAVDDILVELGVNEDDFGTYDPDARDNYKEPAEVACEAVNPFQESFVQLIDFDR